VSFYLIAGATRWFSNMTHGCALSSGRRNVLLCGATSAVGVALGRRLATRGWRLHLLARDVNRVKDVAADLHVRGAVVSYSCFDAADIAGIPKAFATAIAALGTPLDGVIVCHGTLLNEAKGPPSSVDIQRTIDVNFTSVAIILSLSAALLPPNSNSFLAAISSVAGDRGRQSNFCYGSAKAGLSAWLSGLRNRLHYSGIRVLTIKPGIIDSPMTDGLIDGPQILVATPEMVAVDVERAILNQQDVLYTPWFWRPIMLVICMLPEFLFKRMRL
jgi:decaprenylphospho-beta-D-erythro-pentofuranosid-2-ulose 2-reductase